MFFLCHFYINPCQSLFFDRDHLRSNMGITCGAGSFAVQFGDRLRSWDHLRTGTVLFLKSELSRLLLVSKMFI